MNLMTRRLLLGHVVGRQSGSCPSALRVLRRSNSQGRVAIGRDASVSGYHEMYDMGWEGIRPIYSAKSLSETFDRLVRFESSGSHVSWMCRKYSWSISRGSGQ